MSESIAELQARLQQAAELTTQACMQEITQVLEKHGCELIAQPFIDDGRICVNIIVAPKTQQSGGT
ncbi:MAG: hypothetical protein ACYSYL_00055 [Planctomycetota bacterium]|jgi:hypothetical protein